jgi:hypothetical protein
VFCIKLKGSTYQEVSCDIPDSFLVVTRVELVQMSPFYLDTQSAVEIVGATLMIMAVAFVLRQIRKSLD